VPKVIFRRWNSSWKKNNFFSWKSNIFETVRDRKKIVDQKFNSLIIYSYEKKIFLFLFLFFKPSPLKIIF